LGFHQQASASQAQEINMFGKSNGKGVSNQDSSSAQQVQRSTVPYSAATTSSEAISSISSRFSIVGKIEGQGTLHIFGRVEGEIHASTVQISDGAQVEGSIFAEELTIGGHVKGTIHANRVKLTSTAVVVADIFHQSLAIEENGQFEGMSRRQDTVIDAPSRALPAPPQAEAVSTDDKPEGNSGALHESA
jgi:cytoskeletal protein CcmA (bactofilin family)